MNLILPDKIEASISTISEHHAVHALAKGIKGKEETQNFLWLMAALTTALDALSSASPEDTANVLSGVFGLVYTRVNNVIYGQKYVLRSWMGKERQEIGPHYVPADLFSYNFWVDFLDPTSAWGNKCERENVRGKRLREDINTWRFLADISGLQEKTLKFAPVGKFTTVGVMLALKVLNQKHKAMLACLISAIIRFGLPCEIQDTHYPTGGSHYFKPRTTPRDN
jgi:hypothetical protein